MKIKLTIADDHPMVIKGLTGILQPHPHMEVLAAYETGKSLLQGLAMNLPDVLLLDLQLPDVQDTELVRQILTRYPDLRILIVTSVDNPYRARDLIKLGCAGYLIKSTTPETLIEAIETVYRGEEFLEPKLKDQILTAVLRSTKKNGNHSTLTKREREIL